MQFIEFEVVRPPNTPSRPGGAYAGSICQGEHEAGVWCWVRLVPKDGPDEASVDTGDDQCDNVLWEESIDDVTFFFGCKNERRVSRSPCPDLCRSGAPLWLTQPS